MKAIIHIREDGQVEAYNFDLRHLGFTHVTKRRVSHIWPCNPIKRVAFRAIRALAGDKGWVADWTRRWIGPWQVRWVFNTKHVAYTAHFREWCVQWEDEQLQLMGGQHGTTPQGHDHPGVQ